MIKAIMAFFLFEVPLTKETNRDTNFDSFCREYTKKRPVKSDLFQSSPLLNKKLQNWVKIKKNPRYLFDCFINSNYQDNDWIKRELKKTELRSKPSNSLKDYFSHKELQEHKITSQHDTTSYRKKIPAIKSHSSKNIQYPGYINWIRKGIIALSEDQGSCGSCFIFATLAAIDAMARKQGKDITPLSLQEPLDCIDAKNSCISGYVSAVLEYIISNGLEYNDNYPYLGKEHTCKVLHPKISDYNQSTWESTTEIPSRLIELNEQRNKKDSKNDILSTFGNNFQIPLKRFFGLKGFTQKRYNILSLLDVLKKGPVIAAHLYHTDLREHNGAIYFDINCSLVKENWHYILIVGANIYDIFPYLWIKNSWGSEYNIKGFYRMAIGPLTVENPGPCNLFKNDMFQPILKKL